MALDLVAAMTALTARLAAVPGLRAAQGPVDAANPPQAIVALPEQAIEYDSTAGRGSDRAVIPVTVLVGKVSDRTARAAVAGFLSGTGATSIKTAVEGADATLGGAVLTCRVTSSTVEVVTVSSVEYLGASFDVEVYG